MHKTQDIDIRCWPSGKCNWFGNTYLGSGNFTVFFFLCVCTRECLRPHVRVCAHAHTCAQVDPFTGPWIFVITVLFVLLGMELIS